jgi:hypothetical protein
MRRIRTARIVTVSARLCEPAASTFGEVSERDDFLDDLGSDQLLLAGVWADWATVHRGRSAFTDRPPC